MSTYGGEPAITQVNLPTAKSIASTSASGVIIVTTSATHNIATGSYVRVAGAADAAANGDWLAGSVTPTTVALTIIPGGGNSTSGGGGGAAGTILDLGFGLLVTLPDDTTTTMDASSVNVPFEDDMDRTAYLMYAKVARAGDTMTGNLATPGITFAPAVTVTRTARAVAYSITGTWTRDLVTSTGGLISSAVGTVAAFDIDPPHGSVLSEVSAWITPSGGHSALPATMPVIDVRRVHMNGGGTTSLGMATDGSLNTTSYQQPHSINVFGLAATVDRSGYRYIMVFSDELGANSQAGMDVYGCSFAYTITNVGLD